MQTRPFADVWELVRKQQAVFKKKAVRPFLFFPRLFCLQDVKAKMENNIQGHPQFYQSPLYTMVTSHGPNLPSPSALPPGYDTCCIPTTFLPYHSSALGPRPYDLPCVYHPSSYLDPQRNSFASFQGKLPVFRRCFFSQFGIKCYLDFKPLASQRVAQQTTADNLWILCLRDNFSLTGLEMKYCQLVECFKIKSFA